MVSTIVDIQASHIFCVMSACRRPMSMRGKRYSTTEARSCAGSIFLAKAFHLQSMTNLFVTCICLDQFKSNESQIPRYRKASELSRDVIFLDPSTDHRSRGSPEP